MEKLTEIIKNLLSGLWRGKSDLLIDINTPLISSGLIDSFHVVELLIIIEKEYGVKIDQADIGTDNFDTINQIHEYLKVHK